MTDEEKRVDEEIQSHLKKVYGFSEDQLLKEVEAAEKSVNDLDFSGAEDRIYERMMERRAEKEKREETVEECMADKPETEDIDKEKAPARKVVRFRKKTILLVAAVAAILALMLGSTAIGEKNYFFRVVGDGVNHVVAIDNDKNKLELSSIEEAYKEIEKEWGVELLKFGYLPTYMKLEHMDLEKNRATIYFEFENASIVYFIEKKNKEISISIESDRKDSIPIYNKWISKEIEIMKNELPDGSQELEAKILVDDVIYNIHGKMNEIEFKNIVENFNFFKKSVTK